MKLGQSQSGMDLNQFESNQFDFMWHVVVKIRITATKFLLKFSCSGKAICLYKYCTLDNVCSLMCICKYFASGFVYKHFQYIPGVTCWFYNTSWSYSTNPLCWDLCWVPIIHPGHTLLIHFIEIRPLMTPWTIAMLGITSELYCISGVRTSGRHLTKYWECEWPGCPRGVRGSMLPQKIFKILISEMVSAAFGESIF